MQLGVFSMSLSVKDLQRSKEFYETLGFHQFGGDFDKNYLIMKQGDSLIGLFQGMFEGNILTFNPGWDSNAQNIESFDDVRAIEQELEAAGISLVQKTTSESGPASIILQDPDGNMIFIDQHR